MVDKLSDHFYLEDVETLSTDQMLLTQLSIISSYCPLWNLFHLTEDGDALWVLIGIVVYQCRFRGIYALQNGVAAQG